MTDDFAAQLARVADLLERLVSGDLVARHPSADPALPLAAAADYCGVHVQTLRQAARERAIGYLRSGPMGHYRFRISDLNAWLTGQATNPRKKGRHCA